MRRWGSWAVAALALGCAPETPPPSLLEPPLGVWPLVSIDGAIQVRYGGSPVICRSGRVEYLPAPLYDDEVDSPSSVALERESFRFSMVFDQDGYLDRYSNGSEAADSFRGRWPETLTGLRTEGSWSWEQRTVSGAVASGSSPRRELHPTADLEPVPVDEAFEEPWLRFEVAGNFLGPTELAGEWSYRELTRLGGCWSAGRGSGSWSARAQVSEPAGERSP